MKLESQFQKYNFFRSPAWRWNRVLRIVDRQSLTPGRCSRTDDKFVRAARNFLVRFRNKRSDEERDEMWREFPAIFYAHTLHTREQTDPTGAFCVQARLLAGQGYHDIAEAMQIHPEAVKWYEALFFEVTPYLKAKDWICTQIIIPAFLRRVNPTDEQGNPLPFQDSSVAKPFYDCSLKLLAFFGGPKIVDALIHGLESGKLLTSLDDLPNWYDYQMATTVRRRSLQASLQFDINKYNVGELFAAHAKIMELERSEDAQNQKKSVTETHIKALIEGIPWAVGDKVSDETARGPLARYDNQAAELRDDEILQIGGGDTDAEPEDWIDVLPAPRPREAKLLVDENAKLT